MLLTAVRVQHLAVWPLLEQIEEKSAALLGVSETRDFLVSLGSKKYVIYWPRKDLGQKGARKGGVLPVEHSRPTRSRRVEEQHTAWLSSRTELPQAS